MPKLFVWDYHGTLCKGAEEAMKPIMESVLEVFGIKRDIKMQEILQLFGKPWGDCYRYFQPALTKEEIAGMVELSRKFSLEFSPRFIKPTDNVHHVLDKIKKSGDANVIVSSTEPKTLRWFIEFIAISHLVDHAVGIPDWIDKNGGNPTEYKALQVKEFAKDVFDDIVVTGDRESDVEIGKMLNAKTFLLSGNPVKTKADRIISELTQVLDIYNS